MFEKLQAPAFSFNLCSNLFSFKNLTGTYGSRRSAGSGAFFAASCLKFSRCVVKAVLLDSLFWLVCAAFAFCCAATVHVVKAALADSVFLVYCGSYVLQVVVHGADAQPHV